MENWHWTVLQPVNILATMASEHILGLKFQQKLSIGNQQIKKKLKKKGKEKHLWKNKWKCCNRVVQLIKYMM